MVKSESKNLPVRSFIERSPHFCKYYLQELNYSSSHSEVHRNTLWCIQQEDVGNHNFIILQNILFFLTRPPSRETILPEPNLLGFLLEPNCSKKGEYPTPAHTSVLLHLRGRRI